MGNSGAVFIRCERCNRSYFTVSSHLWNKSGTVRRDAGYCGSCFHNDTCSQTPDWRGDVVRIDCTKCGKTHAVVQWSDWKQSGDLWKTRGFCGSCYEVNQLKALVAEKKQAAAEFEKQAQELKKQQELERKEHKRKLEMEQKEKEKAEMKAKEVEKQRQELQKQQELERQKHERQLKIEQKEKEKEIAKQIQLKRQQELERKEHKRKLQMQKIEKQKAEMKAKEVEQQRQELQKQQELERKEHERKLKIEKIEKEKAEKRTEIAKQNGVLNVKRESLTAVEKEIMDIDKSLGKEQIKYDTMVVKIKEQSQAIQNKWFNIDDVDGKEAELNISTLDKIDLLQSELSKRRVLVCIGKTGFGKSTFLNRMIGDTSKQGNGKNAKEDNLTSIFKAGRSINSVTSSISHKFIKHKFDGKEYCLVDTPGSSDSYGRDNDITNNIGEYLNGCGGVNAFCVFVNLGDSRIDNEYIKLLKLYNDMFGDSKWWDNVIIIATNLDTFLFQNRFEFEEMNDTEKDNCLKNRVNDIINRFKSEKELDIPDELSMTFIPIGHDNYQKAIKELLSKVPRQKFVCNKIASPLNKLKDEVIKQKQVVEDKRSEINQSEKRKKTIENEIQAIEKNIQQIEQVLQSVSTEE